MSRKALLLKLALLALCVDLLARAIVGFSTPGRYAFASRAVRRSDVRFLFIGSSRVAAAIDPDAFVRELGAEGVALNLGRGFHTLTEDYFGLRRLAAARPGGLSGVVVFVEAPMDRPALLTWSDSWLDSSYPELLSDVMAARDLPRFWRESGTGMRAKACATAALITPAAPLAGKGKDIVEAVIVALQKRGLVPSLDAGDVSRAGGIRADPAALRYAREYAVQYVGEQVAHQRPFAEAQADRTVLRSIVDLVRGAGGSVVLYRMPISSVFRAPYETQIGLQAGAAMTRTLSAWNVQTLVPEFETTDDDFPDLWHLRASRAAEFSRSLARAYADRDRGRAARDGADRAANP